MKKLFYIIVIFPLLVFGQSTEQNHIRNRTYKKGSTESGFDINNPAHVTTNVTYFDGLGRPMQQVAHKQSETGTDIVTPITYDKYGRKTYDHLPRPMSTSNMLYTSNQVLLNTSNLYYSADFPNETSKLHSESRLEHFPQNRVLEKGAPGNAWAVDSISDSDNTIKFAYETNTANEVRLLKATATWNPATMVYNIAPVSSGFYGANQLYKTVTKDENWKPNQVPPNSKSGITEEFKNKQGQVLLKRTYDGVTAHDTYFVYDQFDNLTYVLPPLANGSILELNALCYQYKYDHRNRLVEKKLPGRQWEFIVYDMLDRVVATGPAYSPFGVSTQGWMVTRYDAFSRPVITGWYQAPSFTPATRNTLQNSYNGAIINATKGTSVVDAITIGHTAGSLPSGFKLLTVNYYDDYDFPGAPAAFSAVVDGQEQAYYNNSDKKPRGLPTGSWVRVLTTASSTSAEKSHILYDSKGRPVRNHTVNHLGGYTYADIKLDFIGKVQNRTTYHKRLQGSTELKTREDFTYTDQDRLLAHMHQISLGTTAQPVERLAMNEYYELGQLKVKRVGGDPAAAGLQKVDYRYNIRGWLKDINNVGALAQQGDPVDLFAFRINYNEVENGVGGAVVPLYNGNISETFWRTSGDDVLRKYGHAYDGLNRLTEAIYQKPDLQGTGMITDAYNEEVAYDKNGNITRIFRNGYQDNDAGNTYEIDRLAYDYHYNQLLKVVDHTNSIDGFKDGQDPDGPSKPDYKYDDYGNMKTDWNKGISDITYNHLNLPLKIKFGSDGLKQIDYIYNAVGTKVRKVVSDRSVSPVLNQMTDYQSGFQYLGNELQFFPTAEGYVNVTSGTKFDYVYNYTDHLGNIRLSYSKPKTEPLKILEENHYYPFGMKHLNYGTQKNKYVLNPDKSPMYAVLEPVERGDYQYKYQGEEYQDELGLNVYSYGWRDYDPAIGRFNKIDRFTEKYSDVSPYSYITNNPVFFREIKGDSIRAAFYDIKGNRSNMIPKEVQKMFSEEFGIKIGYNSKTQMLYYVGSVDSELSQSEDATNAFVDALKDTNSGAESGKHGQLEFGYNRRYKDGSGNVDGGAYSAGWVQINLATYDSNGDDKTIRYSSALNHRAFNMARIFEHEYFGHFRQGKGARADGGRFSMGSAVEISNVFSRQRGLPERLHYGDGVDNRIYFGNTLQYGSPGEQRRAVRDMVNRPGTNNLFIEMKK